MKIISITMAYNEADVLELFLRHHLQCVDHMIIILHGQSVDHTHEIARSLYAEGLPITVEYSDVEGHQQSKIVTETLHKAIILHHPDLILMLDCDEFLCSSQATVRRALEELPRDVITAVPWRTFVPMGTESPWYLAMTHRRSEEVSEFTKVIIPQSFFHPDTVVTQGSHSVISHGVELFGSMSTDLWLAHVPIRSAAQARQKALNAWPRQRSSPSYKPGHGFQWEALYHLAKQCESFSHDDLIQIAARYTDTRQDVCSRLLRDPFMRYIALRNVA